MGSSSDGRSLDEVKQNQMDRLDEMQKLDGEVIGLNNAYIDILERITNKLDLLATLADEIETDTRSHPESMEDGLKVRFDLLTQSALMNRYMCSKALFQNAIGSIQAMSQFGCNYIDNRLIGAPVAPSTNEENEDSSQAHNSDASGDTLAFDSDATVAARMDQSDSQLSVNDDDMDTSAGPSVLPSTSVPSAPAVPAPLKSPLLPSTLDFEEGDINAYLARELEEIREEDEKERLISQPMVNLLVEIPKDLPENAVSLASAQSQRTVEWSQDCDERRSIADSFRSIESMESVVEKKRKKKKKKRSKSSEQRRRSKEAEKMENILNKHLKRSREKEPKKRKGESRKKSPEQVARSTTTTIEVVTLSDDDHGRLLKKSKVDGGDDRLSISSLSSRVIPGPMTPAEDDNRENMNVIKDEIQEMKNEKAPLSTSNQVLSAIAHPPNARVSSVPRPPPPPPPPLPPPVTPSLGRGPGFVAAAMEEAPITPSNWSSLNLEREREKERQCAADLDSSVSEKSMIERPESRGEAEEGGNEKKEKKKRKDSRCESRGSLKERLEEEIKLRESGRFSPDRRGRSRSLSYSPRRARSRSRERSRSRSRERREWRWGTARFRYGYNHRYRRWSRSPTRSRSRSRHRSYSRDRDEWRDRSMSRSRSRSRTRSRSRSRSWRGRSRSATPSSSNGRDAKSPMPRSYARFRNRSSELREKKERERIGEKEKEEEVGGAVVKEGAVASSSVEEVTARASSPSPSTPISTLLPPPPPPFIPPYDLTSSVSPSSRPHSGSSSPSIFVPPPPILLPPKPPALKISIPSTLPMKKTKVSRDRSSSSLLRPSSTPLETAKSLLPSTGENTGGGEEKAVEPISLRRNLSDMSLEGNTVSEGSNGEEKKNKKCGEGEECVPLPPPPSLPPLPPLPLFPPLPPIPGIPRGTDTSSLPETSAARVTTTSTPVLTTVSKTTVAVNRSSVNRAMNGPHPIYPLLGPNPHPHQYYPGPHNPYGPQAAWMHQDPQWQNYYYNYNADPAMMGAYGIPSGAHQYMTHGPIPEAQGSFIKAMRVIPSQINQQPPPDWAQMAREHANQQLLSAVPPPPPLNQQGIMMGHPLYGTPQSSRGASRYRRPGGKDRRY